jgi:hypothetical protein
MNINGRFSEKVTRISVLILIVLNLYATQLRGQVGGNNTYDFLNLTNSARVAALGGDFLSINDDDITLAITNPSLINASMDQYLALSIVDYYADVNYGFAAYAQTFEKYGSFVGAIQFVNYGKFNYANEVGSVGGKFGASEMAVQLGWAKTIAEKFSLGSNLKWVYSSFEDYNSYGLAIDLAASFFDIENDFSASLIMKNIGWQIKAYRSGNQERFPFEIEFGLSKKLKHIPFRYSILINHLNKWDLSYENPYASSNDAFLLTENQTTESLKFSDRLFRHVVIGGELLLSENFIVRLGYNYKRRKELGIETKLSTVGFSWGFEFKISRFRLSYARSAYHLAGSPNYFTITTNVADLFKK